MFSGVIEVSGLYNFFPCYTHLNMKFILLRDVKMPTVIGILTFTSRINTTSESFEAVDQVSCPVEVSMKKFYTVKPVLSLH